jgi:hypothetical protein
MSERMDSKLRELTYQLVAMAPEAPPFPEEPAVHLEPAPRRRHPLLWAATAAAVALVVVGVPLLLLRGDASPDTTFPVATSLPQTPTSTSAPEVTTTSMPQATTTTRPEPEAPACSAAGLDEPLVAQPGLPAAVAETRQAIYDAAIACDIPALVEIASAGERDFTASFGGQDAATLWTEREAAGVPVLADLVRHLNLAYAEPDARDSLQVYVWPFAVSMTSADGSGIPAEDLAALLEIYPIEELRQQFEIIGGYVGRRTGITDDGEWLFFVEGD